MDYATKNVGLIRPGSKTATRTLPILGEDERTTIGATREHWDGMTDAKAITRPGIASPLAEAVGRRMVREHSIARYGRHAVEAMEHRAALTASGVFWQTQLDIIDASALAVNTASDTFDIRLLQNTGTPNYDTNTLWSALSATEVAATGGYTADGAALSGFTVAISAGLNWDATDAAWTTSTITSHGCVIVDDTLTGDPMICLIWFGGAVASDGGTFTIVFATGGFIQNDLA